jgi:NADPH:quinone reductase-like Zn-dependent oxidoreductase
VQLARHFGATVTGVCSGPHPGLVRRLGASSVVDYTRADFTRAGRRYDVVFDVAGTSSFGRCRRVLNPGGVYLTTAPSPAIFVQMAWTARFGAFGAFGGRRAVVAFTGLRAAGDKRRDLEYMAGLASAPAPALAGTPAAAGTPALAAVIAARYPLAQIAEAYRRVDAGHKKGNVVVTMA